ncbi:MTEF4 factor, partial [Atlantisia rogersi]|nr:MTEF4 factor [Atlantisia rogersi]
GSSSRCRDMAARLLQGCCRPAPACWAPALRSSPGPCRGCGEASALRNMGFNEEQTRQLLELQPRLGPQRREAAVAQQLLLLGLNAETALGLLERIPALLRMPPERLQERTAQLRRLGLDGGRM